MKKVLLDTNVILDFLLEREPFFVDAEKILKQAFNKEIFAYVSATSITDIYYIAKKVLNKDVTLNLLKGLLDFVEVANVGKEVILHALNSDLKDFEDAVQDNSAQYNQIDLIITRDVKDFNRSLTKIRTPSEFIKE